LHQQAVLRFVPYEEMETEGYGYMMDIVKQIKKEMQLT
jgi:hypothetical protein